MYRNKQTEKRKHKKKTKRRTPETRTTGRDVSMFSSGIVFAYSTSNETPAEKTITPQPSVGAIFLAISSLLMATIVPFLALSLILPGRTITPRDRFGHITHMSFEGEIKNGKIRVLIGTPPALIDLDIVEDRCGITLWSDPSTSITSLFPSIRANIGEAVPTSYGMDIVVSGGARLVCPVRYDTTDRISADVDVATLGTIGFCPETVRAWGLLPEYFARCSKICVGNGCRGRPGECGLVGVGGLLRSRRIPWSVIACVRSEHDGVFELAFDPITAVGKPFARTPSGGWTPRLDASAPIETARFFGCNVTTTGPKSSKKDAVDGWTVGLCAPDPTIYFYAGKNGERMIAGKECDFLATSTRWDTKKTGNVGEIRGDDRESKTNHQEQGEKENGMIVSCTECDTGREIVTVFAIVNLTVAYALRAVSSVDTNRHQRRRQTRPVIVMVAAIVSCSCYFVAWIGRACGWIIHDDTNIPQWIVELVFGIMVAVPTILSVCGLRTRSTTSFAFHETEMSKQKRRRSAYERLVSYPTTSFPLYATFWYISYAEGSYIARLVLSCGAAVIAATSVIMPLTIQASLCADDDLGKIKTDRWFIGTTLFAAMVSAAAFSFAIFPMLSALFGNTTPCRLLYAGVAMSIIGIGSFIITTRSQRKR